MKSSDVRGKFIKYFEKNGHTPVSSSSLIPDNDPTLLFTNAGMNQFKNIFLGLEDRGYRRAVSSQKCVRAGGKHNDLENVGFTARHHTFFEMLGNFSFGDYFKKEAIHFAWELLTKEFGIPKEKLYVTVFNSDDEAADIWHKQEGVPRDRIFRFGEKDNFWRMGDTGPCGPCTEIFYDHGEHAGKEKDPFKGIASGEDRFVEIWNLVFMQFFEKAPGQMDPLPKPSVDTGSGLERLVAALQGKLNNYDTDLFWPLIQKSAEIAKRVDLLEKIHQKNKEGIHCKLDSKTLQDIAALRVVADHVRSASFLIADGAIPSNEGRGYVLRRILRRAIRFSQLLSGGDAFLPEVSQVLISEMKDIYPELQARKNVVLATLSDEQSRFTGTLTTGTQLLNAEIQKIKSSGQKNLSGEVAFKLYDTYGFPLDLTRLMAAEQNLELDEQGFENHMNKAKERAKASWKGKGLGANEAHLIQAAQSQKTATAFTGYQETKTKDCKIIFLSNGQNKSTSLKTGSTGFVILDKTPFYAEGGGQVGDHGELIAPRGKAQVLDCTKNNDVHIHHVEVIEGELYENDSLLASVQGSDRRKTAANHSATHLLHSALRKVLGTHVTQAGQLVDSQKIRFDFTHNKPLSSEEIKQLEFLVNQEIQGAHAVTTEVMSHSQALKKGALALFGEKYKSDVRVLSMGDFSMELCGGTHVSNTSQIRLFKVVSESGVSAGVRRIEALSGENAIDYLQNGFLETLVARQAAGIETSWAGIYSGEQALPQWVESKKDQIKQLEKELKKAQSQQVDVDQIVSTKKIYTAKSKKLNVVSAEINLDDRELLSQLTDQIKNKLGSGVVVVLGHGENNFPLIVSVTKDLNPEVTAGGLLKEISSLLGGKGGGRPDFAQGSVPRKDDFNKCVDETLKKLQ